jgi:hypothetical protein
MKSKISHVSHPKESGIHPNHHRESRKRSSPEKGSAWVKRTAMCMTLVRCSDMFDPERPIALYLVPMTIAQ